MQTTTSAMPRNNTMNPKISTPEHKIPAEQTPCPPQVGSPKGAVRGFTGTGTLKAKV
jgi:hypothetical protein